MSRFTLFLLMLFALSLPVACSKGGDAPPSGETGTGDTAQAADEAKPADDVKPADDTKPQGDAKPEAKAASADSVEGLFALLDQAIKAGKLDDARALYDAASSEKVKDEMNEAFLPTTLDGVISENIKTRGAHKNPIRIEKKDANSATIRFPNNKVTKVAITKAGGVFRIDLLKSDGGDNLM